MITVWTLMLFMQSPALPVVVHFRSESQCQDAMARATYRVEQTGGGTPVEVLCVRSELPIGLMPRGWAPGEPRQ